jgi:hypothetical protein
MERRAELERKYKSTWKEVTFSLFKRDAVPASYRRPSQEWHAFSMCLLYSFTPRWTKNGDRTGTYTLRLIGKEHFESTSSVTFEPTIIDETRNEESTGMDWLIPTVSLAAITSTTQRKQRRRRTSRISKRTSRQDQTLTDYALC